MTKLKKGMYVTCKIQGIQIDDAKIQFEDGEYYICQNVKDGCDCKNKLGYKYSWDVEDGSDDRLYYNDVTDLKIVDPLEWLEVGDRVRGADGVREVLAVIHRRGEKTVYAMSKRGQFHYAGGVFTAFELKLNDYKKVTHKKKSKKVVVSMDQIAERFGVDVKKLKIKK